MHNMTEHTVLEAVSDLSHAVEAVGPIATVAYIVVVSLSITMWLFVWACACVWTWNGIGRIYRGWRRARTIESTPLGELVCMKIELYVGQRQDVIVTAILRDVHSVTEGNGCVDWIDPADGGARSTYGRILKTWTSDEDRERVR